MANLTVKEIIGQLWEKVKEKDDEVKREVLSEIQNIQIQIVSVLPESGEERTIYFVSKTKKDKDTYDEYMWISGAWEHIGNTDIDLSAYVLKKTTIAGLSLENNITDVQLVTKLKSQIITAVADALFEKYGNEHKATSEAYGLVRMMSSGDVETMMSDISGGGDSLPDVAVSPKLLAAIIRSSDLAAKPGEDHHGTVKLAASSEVGTWKNCKNNEIGSVYHIGYAIENGAWSDEEMSDTSKNIVQNKVVKKYVDDIKSGMTQEELDAILNS